MIEKGRISASQMGIMMYPVVVATGDLLVPAITAKAAGRDMWLSPIWASLSGFLIVYIVCQLNRLYPKETIIQYSVHILGTIPGRIIGFLSLFIFLYDGGYILREYGDFINSHFLIKTPTVVVLASMALVCAFAVRGGVEVLARAAQFFVPIVILLWVLIIIMLIPELKPENMLPVMEKGIMPSLKGAVTPQVWFSLFFFISFLLPFLTDLEKGMKSGMISVFFVMLTLTVLNLTALLLFGGITGSLEFPLMEAGRYISIAAFLEHLEVLLMAIWVTGAFIKITVFYYALALGTAQWLNLADYRPIVFPLGFLLVLFSIWAAPNLQELAAFATRAVPFYDNTFYMVIPMLLLLIALLRKKVSG